MPPESQISMDMPQGKRFAVRLALFYSAMFAALGTQLPFFPAWLKAIGIDATWIGIINALPAVARFTTLPYASSLAERHQVIRGAIIIAAIASAVGFAVVGTQHQPLSLFLVYAVTCVVWTPTIPLTDAYALRVVRYGLNYGPLRLWGSAAFAVGAVVCGGLVEFDKIDARELIWVIVALATVAALVSFLLRPLDDVRRKTAVAHSGKALLRDPSFLVIIVSAALIQCSHVAYNTFASISWQAHGLGWLTIAALWTLGVLAEILVFALSPRFSLHPSLLMVIGGVSAVVRWVITASDPSVPLLSIV